VVPLAQIVNFIATVSHPGQKNAQLRLLEVIAMGHVHQESPPPLLHRFGKLGDDEGGEANIRRLGHLDLADIATFIEN
jgi:hypothetical protein